MNIEVIDSEGNQVFCHCGNPASGSIMGKEACKIWCKDCNPYKDQPSAEFMYRAPDTTSDKYKLAKKMLDNMAQ